MTERRDVPAAEFGKWAKMITQERGVVALKINHQPECPAHARLSLEQLEEVAEAMKAGGSPEEVPGVRLCTCETVEVEIS